MDAGCKHGKPSYFLSHSYAGITRIRFEGSGEHAASQPTSVSTPWSTLSLAEDTPPCQGNFIRFLSPEGCAAFGVVPER